MRGLTVIHFIGIDGSGKSTLARLLQQQLSGMNINSSYTWWFEGENSSVRRLLRRIGGTYRLDTSSDGISPRLAVGTRDRLPGILNELYLAIVILDYVRFGLTKVRNMEVPSKETVLVFDRSIYDIVFALCKEFNIPRNRRIMLLRFCRNVLPKPRMIFMIDVPPELGYSRKSSEFKTIEEARILWEDYQELLSSLNVLNVGKIVRVDNSGTIETASTQILGTVLDSIGVNRSGS